MSRAARDRASALTSSTSPGSSRFGSLKLLREPASDGGSTASPSAHPASAGLLHAKIPNDADDEPLGGRLALACCHAVDGIGRRQEELLAAID